MNHLLVSNGLYNFIDVRIEPFKAWNDVINSEFFIHLIKFQFYFNLSLFYSFHLMIILVPISCTIHNLGALEVV